MPQSSDCRGENPAAAVVVEGAEVVVAAADADAAADFPGLQEVWAVAEVAAADVEAEAAAVVAVA